MEVGQGGEHKEILQKKIVNEQSRQLNSPEEQALIASALKNIEQNKRKNPPKQQDISGIDSDSETDEDRYAAGSRRLPTNNLLSTRSPVPTMSKSRGPVVELSSRPSPTSLFPNQRTNNISAELLGAGSSVNRTRESTGGGDPRLPSLLGMPAFVDSDATGNETVYGTDLGNRNNARIDNDTDFDDFFH